MEYPGKGKIIQDKGGWQAHVRRRPCGKSVRSSRLPISSRSARGWLAPSRRRRGAGVAGVAGGVWFPWLSSRTLEIPLGRFWKRSWMARPISFTRNTQRPQRWALRFRWFHWFSIVLYFLNKLSGLERLVKKTPASKPNLLLSLQPSRVNGAPGFNFEVA